MTAGRARRRRRRHGHLEDLPDPALRPRLPYPNGWFAVAFSDEVRAGQVQRRRLMGEDVVVYRTRSGTLRVVDPYCPHLGAHLAHGGKVEGEQIVCPFHRFAFDTTGACVRTGYGTRPPRARLSQRRAREVNGVVMVWRHAAGAEPDWEVPAIPTTGFPRPVRRAYTIVDHPQEIVENAVDIGHIGPIHHYRNVRVRRPMAVDGPRFTIGPAAERVLPGVGRLDVEFDVEAHGLGYIFVTARLPRLRAAALFQAMATPIDPLRVEVRFTVSIRIGRGAARSSTWSPLLSRALTVGLARAFWADLTLDFPIWENKVLLERPRLARGDGPVIPFRRWARQFYSEPVPAYGGAFDEDLRRLSA